MLGVENLLSTRAELAGTAGSNRYALRPSAIAVKPPSAPHSTVIRQSWVLLSILLVAALTTSAATAGDPVAEEMKARVAAASPGDRPHLCVQIAERQLTAADKLYVATEVEQAQALLPDVVAFSELARDYAIQTHKYQKQTEIAVRSMARKLAEIKHVVAHDDQAPIQDAINRLQRVRDDLLMAMFPKGLR